MRRWTEYAAKAIAPLKQALIRSFHAVHIPSNGEPVDNQTAPRERQNARLPTRYSPRRSEYPDNHWIRWG